MAVAVKKGNTNNDVKEDEKVFRCLSMRGNPVLMEQIYK